MRSLPQDVYIVAAKRTAFGTFGGSLKHLGATDLAVHAGEAALAASGVERTDIDQVIFGNVLQTSADAIYLPRHVGLRCGIPEEVPALGVNRLCGSGFQAVVSAAEQILTGQAEMLLCGGTESMSQAPHALRGIRWGTKLGHGELEDTLWSALFDTYAGMPMGMTAEELGARYDISEAAVDEYSALTQQRFAAAQASGRFDAEIAPVEIKRKRETVAFAKDEHNRPETTVASFAKLPKVFKKDGLIHAGAASGICDGAAALVVASKAYVEAHGLKPLARLVGWGIAGVDPKIMGLGPAPAIRRALAMTETKLSDFALVEVNEAFAPQVLAVEKELGLERDRLNVNGGAIAVGHPLAASGARITTHLVHELRRRGDKLGLGSACIGGGQGMAVVIEALD